jgi:hypothetical protein
VRPYFVSPLFDSLFVCGGAVWLLFLITLCVNSQTSNSHQIQFLYQLSALGAVFLSACHSLATPVLEAGERSAYVSSYAASKPGLYLLAAIAIALLVLSSDAYLKLPLIAVLCKYYLLLVPYHFLFQVKGIFLIYCRRVGGRLSGKWRRRLDFLMHMTALYWVAFLLSAGQQAGQTFLFLDLPVWPIFADSFVAVARLFVCACAICYCICLCFVGRLKLNNKGNKANKANKATKVPWIALLLLVSGLAFFLLPVWCINDLWLFVPSFFHGLQYLIVVNDRLKQTLPGSHKSYSIFFYPVSLLLVLLLYGLPLLFFMHSGWKVIAALFVVLQLWHFHQDGHIWKKKKGDRNIALGKFASLFG